MYPTYLLMNITKSITMMLLMDFIIMIIWLDILFADVLAQVAIQVVTCC